jgi:hypothetical protein
MHVVPLVDMACLSWRKTFYSTHVQAYESGRGVSLAVQHVRIIANLWSMRHEHTVPMKRPFGLSLHAAFRRAVRASSSDVHE